MPELTLVILENPLARHLRLLEGVGGEVRMVTSDRFEGVEEALPEADALLCGLGKGDLLRRALPGAARLRWVHVLSAGVESLMFPELVECPAALTNARGVFRRSLAEFVIGAALFYSKDFRRMVRSQEEGRWDQFDVEELEGKVMGIVGYGEIGSMVAARARAMDMRVVALRRRPELSSSDPLLEAVYGPDQKMDLLRASDFVVLCSPLTPETRGMMGEAELRAMKSSAVLINIGRGPLVPEAALLRALEEGWIRGAALDVFDQEPLPEGHPYYASRKILLSPHCADHTPGWQDLAMRNFLENFERFQRGLPLHNIVDKRSGY